MPLTSLLLQTAGMHDIPNGQSYEKMPTLQSQNNRAHFKKKFPNNTERDPNPTGIYNCHGLTFASRRTQIAGNPTLSVILTDDRYVRIQKANVLPGDIVIFVHPNGDMEHSAVVIVPPSESITGYPKVIGKWGNFTEFVHYANDSDYDVSDLRYYRVQWP